MSKFRVGTKGQTVIQLVVDGKLADRLGLGDVIREESREAIQPLHEWVWKRPCWLAAIRRR